MSHGHKADKLLIKPAAGARPAPPCCPDRSFLRHATRQVTRRVTDNTETPGWRRPQTDRPAESHSHPSGGLRKSKRDGPSRDGVPGRASAAHHPPGTTEAACSTDNPPPENGRGP